MNHQEIEQLGRWLAGTDIGLLELRGPNVHLRLRNDGAGAPVHQESAPEPVPPPAATTVKSASVGVYLQTHPMRLAPLVAEGTRVQAGQTLGLLQIGALLLPVTSPCAGTVTCLHLAHCSTVGYGTPLIDLETT